MLDILELTSAKPALQSSEKWTVETRKAGEQTGKWKQYGSLDRGLTCKDLVERERGQKDQNLDQGPTKTESG